MSNLDLEIKKALNNKIDLDKFMLFTVKVDSETKIDFKINKDINISYTVWADECDMPDSYHALAAFYKNGRTVNVTDDLVKTMTEMIQEIFDVVEQDD